MVKTSAYDLRLKGHRENETAGLTPIPSNYSKSEEASSPVKGAPIIGHPPIHYSNYQKTSQADFDAMKAVAITSENLHKSHETFRTAESIFSMNNLLTLMNGVRQQLEPSPSNPTGYRFPCVITYKGIDYRLSADDVGKFDHDFSRCFPLPAINLISCSRGIPESEPKSDFRRPQRIL